MIKRINAYTLSKVLFILIALALIVIIRVDYYQMNTVDRDLESISPIYFYFSRIRLYGDKITGVWSLICGRFQFESRNGKKIAFK